MSACLEPTYRGLPGCTCSLRERHHRSSQAAIDCLRNGDSRIQRIQRSRTPETRKVQSLSQIGPGAEAPVPTLVRLLQNPEMCKTAAYALGNIGPGAKAAVPALVGLLQDPQAYADAAKALDKIDPEAKVALPGSRELLERLEALEAFYAYQFRTL
jgi:HEAT repeat protein